MLSPYPQTLAAARKDRVNDFLTMSVTGGHAPSMATKRTPRSAGILFAILPLAGAIGLGLRGEPVIGLLAGLTLAAALTTLFWLLDRRT